MRLIKVLLTFATTLSLVVTLFPFLGWSSVAYARDPGVTPRDAKCLLEVKGVHYIGDVCKFVSLDNQGSFRISDKRSGLTAQVNATQKDQGRASWNGPLGQGSGTSLCTVDRTAACWAGENNLLICAWSMDQDVYLGPTPSEPDSSSIIYWGYRVGMFDNIASRKGIDTRYAQIVTSPSRDGVVIFCRTYAQDYSNKCIRDGLRDDHPKTATADCKAKTFVDLSGTRFRFLGKNSSTSGDIFADYLIKDLKSGEILDGSSASGYDIALDTFKTLCPTAVERAR